MGWYYNPIARRLVVNFVLYLSPPFTNEVSQKLPGHIFTSENVDQIYNDLASSHGHGFKIKVETPWNLAPPTRLEELLSELVTFLGFLQAALSSSLPAAPFLS
jgi:hypothetical protein